MFCLKCGVKNEENAKICCVCGNVFGDVTSNVNQTEQPYIQYSQQTIYPIDEHVSIAGWIGRSCIVLIPLVGPLIYFIMLFVWAFGASPKKSLKTFAKAQLIMFLIAVILGIIGVIILFALAAGTVSSVRWY